MITQVFYKNRAVQNAKVILSTNLRYNLLSDIKFIENLTRINFEKATIDYYVIHEGKKMSVADFIDFLVSQADTTVYDNIIEVQFRNWIILEPDYLPTDKLVDFFDIEVITGSIIPRDIVSVLGFSKHFIMRLDKSVTSPYLRLVKPALDNGVYDAYFNCRRHCYRIKINPEIKSLIAKLKFAGYNV